MLKMMIYRNNTNKLGQQASASRTAVNQQRYQQRGCSGHHSGRKTSGVVVVVVVVPAVAVVEVVLVAVAVVAVAVVVPVEAAVGLVAVGVGGGGRGGVGKSA